MKKNIMEDRKELFNSNRRIILAHLIKHTDESQGLTTYVLSRRLELSPGNVVQHLNALSKENKIKKIKSADSDRGKIAYYVPEEIKRSLTEKYPFLEIDMFSEVDFVTKKLEEEGRKTFYEGQEPYFSLPRIAADANNYLKYLADCQYRSFTVYRTDEPFKFMLGCRMAELEDYYGLTFYAIKHSITTKFFFGFIYLDTNYGKGFNYAFKSGWFSVISRHKFLENGRALKNRSENIIDRMFRDEEEGSPFNHVENMAV